MAGLVRPSTPCFAQWPKGVDARHKAGHDEVTGGVASCGVTTGIGAVIYTAKVEPGRQCRGVRARRHRPQRDPGRAHGRAPDKIIGVDLNPGRARLARKFGMTHFVNPEEVQGDRRSGASGRTDRRRRRLFLRVHRQGRRSNASGAGMMHKGRASRSSSARAERGKRSADGCFSWSGDGVSGRAGRSVVTWAH